MKKVLASIIFWFLGRGFQACSAKDSKMKEEISVFDEGMIIMLKIYPKGPSMALKKQNGKIKYIGSNETSGDIIIYFKNMNAAIRVLTGRQSISEAYAQHKFLVKGEISQGMILVRCLNILEGYLFPSFITSKILSDKPKKEVSSFNIFFSILF